MGKLPGKVLTVTEMTAIRGKDIKALYIMGENYPERCGCAPRGKELAALDFLVVQDIFLTETARLADVVLPGVCLPKKMGPSPTPNARCSGCAVLDAPGEAWDDWRIITALARKMGYEMDYTGASAVMEEINTLTPSYGGITYERLENAGLTALPDGGPLGNAHPPHA